jgi:hypothetical protein
VVSVTVPYGRILGFLDRSRYFFSGSAGNRTLDARNDDGLLAVSKEVAMRFVGITTCLEGLRKTMNRNNEHHLVVIRVRLLKPSW